MRAAALILALLVAAAAYARVGGGESYSGGGSSSSSSGSSSGGGSYGGDSSYGGGDSSSSSSGGGESIHPFGCVVVFAIVVFMIVVGQLIQRVTGPSQSVTIAEAAPAPPVDLTPLRQDDPNFSEIVFTDFCYSLFARLHEARGRGGMDDFAPYVSAGVRTGMKSKSPAGLSSVDEIVIGSFRLAEIRYLPRMATISVEFEANYTETASAGTQRWYLRERWVLERGLGVLSPVPTKAKAQHCPRCGAALQTRTDGACLHCGTVVNDGSFNWFVRSVATLQKDARPPVLGGGGGGPEPGLDHETVYQRGIKGKAVEPGFLERVRHVANELQAAWSSRDWHRARPYETDALFQMHRYWIDEYLRQGLRNVVDNYTIGRINIAKATSDAFYDAITVRIFAGGVDYTIDEAGNVVGGTREYGKQWSEYWTFIRGRAGAEADALSCPNCGGARAEGQTAICEYCGGKITTGEFPWILSRIEQDEAYRG